MAKKAKFYLIAKYIKIKHKYTKFMALKSDVYKISSTRVPAAINDVSRLGPVVLRRDFFIFSFYGDHFGHVTRTT